MTRCEACSKALVDGDLVYDDVVNGGTMHAECWGSDPESFVDADSNPLKAGDPIPQPAVYKDHSIVDVALEGEITDFDVLGFRIIDIGQELLSIVLNGACDVLVVSDVDAAYEINPHIFDQHAVIGELAAFVRQIGVRATPEVLAQQLVIKGHRKSAEISRPEAIALKAFASVLIDLDAFALEEKERIARENAPAVEPHKVPIEETTMEPVDDPLGTW